MERRADSELVEAARGGDTASFAALVDRHYARTRALARALAGDEGEDVAQEAVLQAFLGLEHLREPARFGPWLYGIAANLARMRLRRRVLYDVALLRVDGAGRDARPEQAAEEAEAAALVRDALDELAPAQRQAVLLHDVAGYSAGEIAVGVGSSSGAVRVRLHRARRELRRRLAPLNPATEKETTMVEVELRDVVVRLEDGDGGPKLVEENRIVLLQECGGPRVLPIWVGAPEGDALALHLGSEPVPRPLTADLMARLLEATGARVERVVVSSLRENTFYGVVHVVAADGAAQELDSRPSDAINLAVRVGAPMLVDDAVFSETALPSADFADLDRELALKAEQQGLESVKGTWTSLSPELVRTVGSYRPWQGRSSAGSEGAE
ncbi:MAG: bifunctional nuclease domain-containing protein [Gaiellaceae bacterium]